MSLGKQKSVVHLFVLCEVVSIIWYKMFRWVGRLRPLPPILQVFDFIYGFGIGKKVTFRLVLI